MKKVFLIAIIGLVSFATSFSQTVNGVPLKDIDVEFMQIVGISKMLSTKLNINIDFGQYDNIWKSKDTQILDENGKKLVFNSMIDALNFMSKNGYDFIDANAISMGNSNVYHFLLKKVKD